MCPLCVAFLKHCSQGSFNLGRHTKQKKREYKIDIIVQQYRYSFIKLCSCIIYIILHLYMSISIYTSLHDTVYFVILRNAVKCNICWCRNFQLKMYNCHQRTDEGSSHSFPDSAENLRSLRSIHMKSISRCLITRSLTGESFSKDLF
jgi:hypothetical protein